MFEIKRDKTEIQIKLLCPANHYTYTLRYHCAEEDYAILLAEALRDGFYKHMKAIRAAAYQSGWSDAKSHRAKETWFAGDL